MPELPETNSLATGADVGSETIHISIGGGPAEAFGTTTAQLEALRDRLLSQGVTSVAVEATGVYWLCLYDVLEAAGIDVVVVNGRYVRNVPGRKTDVQDCQWLATLHSRGLLRSGFVPTAEIRRLQDYMRLRQDHIVLAASHEQHMQKALERMNLKIHDTIRSLTGVSGLKMVRAIVAGERDPDRLLALCDVQIQKRKSGPLREALRGTWKNEHLFALRQALAAWDFYQSQIRECDEQIEQVLHEIRPSSPPSSSSNGSGAGGRGGTATTDLPLLLPAHKPALALGLKKPKRSDSKNTPKIPDLHQLLMQMCGGQDATAIPGIADYTLLQLISEVGTDMTRWRTAKHFVSWLGLAPGSRQSGKRRGSVKREVNRAGRLFCMVAQPVGRGVDKALGGFYRRLRGRRGAPVANKALARKIAIAFWNTMVYGFEYVEQGLQKYQDKVAATEQRYLRRAAAKHGYLLVPITST